MVDVPIIRNLYTPIQPTVLQTGNHVTYHEFLPLQELHPYIYCYWQLKTRAVLTEPFVYRVVADGCIDIFFELDKPDQSFVMGFCKQYTEFPLLNSFNYVGIRFLPTMYCLQPLVLSPHTFILTYHHSRLLLYWIIIF
jgi:hypothetical protein